MCAASEKERKPAGMPGSTVGGTVEERPAAPEVPLLAHTEKVTAMRSNFHTLKGFTHLFVTSREHRVEAEQMPSG